MSQAPGKAYMARMHETFARFGTKASEWKWDGREPDERRGIGGKATGHCEVCGKNLIVLEYTLLHDVKGLRLIAGSECVGNFVYADDAPTTYADKRRVRSAERRLRDMNRLARKVADYAGLPYEAARGVVERIVARHGNDLRNVRWDESARTLQCLHVSKDARGWELDDWRDNGMPKLARMAGFCGVEAAGAPPASVGCCVLLPGHAPVPVGGGHFTLYWLKDGRFKDLAGTLFSGSHGPVLLERSEGGVSGISPLMVGS